MKPSYWSIADLDRQQLAVARLALRAELGRRELHAARTRLVRKIHAAVGGPLALGGCFLSGVAFGRAIAPLGSAALSGSRHLGIWSVLAAKALRLLAQRRAAAP